MSLQTHLFFLSLVYNRALTVTFAASQVEENLRQELVELRQIVTSRNKSLDEFEDDSKRPFIILSRDLVVPLLCAFLLGIIFGLSVRSLYHCIIARCPAVQRSARLSLDHNVSQALPAYSEEPRRTEVRLQQTLMSPIASQPSHYTPRKTNNGLLEPLPTVIEAPAQGVSIRKRSAELKSPLQHRASAQSQLEANHSQYPELPLSSSSFRSPPQSPRMPTSTTSEAHVQFAPSSPMNGNGDSGGVEGGSNQQYLLNYSGAVFHLGDPRQLLQIQAIQQTRTQNLQQIYDRRRERYTSTSSAKEMQYHSLD